MVVVTSGPRCGWVYHTELKPTGAKSCKWRRSLVSKSTNNLVKLSKLLSFLCKRMQNQRVVFLWILKLFQIYNLVVNSFLRIEKCKRSSQVLWPIFKKRESSWTWVLGAKCSRWGFTQGICNVVCKTKWEGNKKRGKKWNTNEQEQVRGGQSKPTLKEILRNTWQLKR